MAIGLRANVVILDRNLDVLRQLDQQFSGQVQCIYSTKESVEKHVLDADLVVGCVLVAGAAALDQGGCVETSHPTTHNDPTYLVDDVVHYCVANMPGAVARTSTFALNNIRKRFNTINICLMG